MSKIKATIKTAEMTLTVIHKSRMNYAIYVDGIGDIGGRGNLSEAVAEANRIAQLGLAELKTRIAYAQ